MIKNWGQYRTKQEKKGQKKSTDQNRTSGPQPGVQAKRGYMLLKVLRRPKAKRVQET